MSKVQVLERVIRTLHQDMAKAQSEVWRALHAIDNHLRNDEDTLVEVRLRLMQIDAILREYE